MQSVHHLLLAHGMTVKLYKEMNLKKPIGIALNPSQSYTPDNSFKNIIAKNNDDGFRNRLFYDPLFKGEYPLDIINILCKQIKDWDFIKSEDLIIISIPFDFLGINFYSRDYVMYDAESDWYHKAAPSEYETTAMGWEVAPYALKDLVIRLREDYTDIPIYLTENGSAWDDEVEHGKINDFKRIDYLNQHLKVIKDLNDLNMNIQGYYAWSLLDNFEWAYGYTKRFGLVYVDYKTQKRIPKDSYYRYQDIIKTRSL